MPTEQHEQAAVRRADLIEIGVGINLSHCLVTRGDPFDQWIISFNGSSASTVSANTIRIVASEEARVGRETAAQKASEPSRNVNFPAAWLPMIRAVRRRLGFLHWVSKRGWAYVDEVVQQVMPQHPAKVICGPGSGLRDRGRRLCIRRTFGVFGFPFAAMATAFQERGDEMQRARISAIRWLTIGAAVLWATVGGAAFAQSADDSVPDYAALIGVQMSAADVVRARSATASVHDVQRRIDAADVRRTAAERAASEGLNRALARMPETAELALRQAAADNSGAGLVRVSRQEIEPIYAVPSRGGGTNASHRTHDNYVR